MDRFYSSISTVVAAALGLCGVRGPVAMGPLRWLQKHRQKQVLKTLLAKQNGGFVWRKLSMLSQAIGASENETVKLLLAIRARPSLVEGNEYWVLGRRKLILRQKSVADQAA